MYIYMYMYYFTTSTSMVFGKSENSDLYYNRDPYFNNGK